MSTQQPQTGLMSQFYRQVENRLKNIVYINLSNFVATSCRNYCLKLDVAALLILILKLATYFYFSLSFLKSFTQDLVICVGRIFLYH